MKKDSRFYTRLLFFAVTLFFCASSSSAAKVKDLGDPSFKKGGTFYADLGGEPKTLHPINSTDAYASEVQSYILDSLMVINKETYKYEPGLAFKYDVGKNKKSYTFYLRKEVKFHDGKPVTAHDIKFSFDAIMDPKFKAAHTRPYFENIRDAVVINDHTIKFNIKKKYFSNFRVLAGISAIPKHFYKNPKAKLNKTLLGSGPYIFGKYDKGKSLILKRNPNWWGYKVSHLKSSYNYNKILFRFLKEQATRLAYLKSGKIDFGSLSPEQYVKKTKGKPWGIKVLKKKVRNKSPKGYGYVGWNLLDKKFQERNVRRALAHLMNRRLMNDKFRFGMSLLATGPWYRQSPYAANIKPIEFNPKKALKLLRSSGWKDADKDGILEKKIDKKVVKLEFTLISANPDAEKYLTIYKEDLKKAGIRMHLKRIEWNSLLKAIDDKKFEAINLGWGAGSVHNDPKQIWHSSSAAKGGSNFISYKNPIVDKLIDKGRQETDMKKRIKVYKKIYKLIAEDAPYAFMFNNKFSIYAHSKKIQIRKPTYKYSIGSSYWWIKQ